MGSSSEINLLIGAVTPFMTGPTLYFGKQKRFTKVCHVPKVWIGTLAKINMFYIQVPQLVLVV